MYLKRNLGIMRTMIHTNKSIQKQFGPTAYIKNILVDDVIKEILKTIVYSGSVSPFTVLQVLDVFIIIPPSSPKSYWNFNHTQMLAALLKHHIRCFRTLYLQSGGWQHHTLILDILCNHTLSNLIDLAQHIWCWRVLCLVHGSLLRVMWQRKSSKSEEDHIDGELLGLEAFLWAEPCEHYNCEVAVECVSKYGAAAAGVGDEQCNSDEARLVAVHGKERWVAACNTWQLAALEAAVYNAN
ncbi:hypothetical protein CPB85DRAFT_1257003 [Mucidula mucida]|nr:hypothetical protein CPB85DRAFT_1257003 [Mucidula mucida]